MPPDLALLSTLIGSNYPCLELIFIVPMVFELLKFDCIVKQASSNDFCMGLWGAGGWGGGFNPKCVMKKCMSHIVGNETVYCENRQALMTTVWDVRGLGGMGDWGGGGFKKCHQDMYEPYSWNETVYCENRPAVMSIV